MVPPRHSFDAITSNCSAPGGPHLIRTPAGCPASSGRCRRRRSRTPGRPRCGYLSPISTAMPSAPISAEPLSSTRTLLIAQVCRPGVQVADTSRKAIVVELQSQIVTFLHRPLFRLAVLAQRHMNPDLAPLLSMPAMTMSNCCPPGDVPDAIVPPAGSPPAQVRGAALDGEGAACLAAPSSVTSFPWRRLEGDGLALLACGRITSSPVQSFLYHHRIAGQTGIRPRTGWCARGPDATVAASSPAGATERPSGAAGRSSPP